MNISVARDENNCNIKPTLVIWQCRFKKTICFTIIFYEQINTYWIIFTVSKYKTRIALIPITSILESQNNILRNSLYNCIKRHRHASILTNHMNATNCRIKRFAPPVLGSHFLVYLLHNILTLVVYLYSTKPNKLLCYKVFLEENEFFFITQ